MKNFSNKFFVITEIKDGRTAMNLHKLFKTLKLESSLHGLLHGIPVYQAPSSPILSSRTFVFVYQCFNGRVWGSGFRGNHEISMIT